MSDRTRGSKSLVGRIASSLGTVGDRQLLLRVTGGAALVAAAVVGLVPSVLTTTGVARFVRPFASIGVIAVLGFVATALAVLALGQDTASETGTGVSSPKYGSERESNVETTGEAINRPLAVLRDPDGSEADLGRERAALKLERRLTETATEVLVTIEGFDRGEAKGRLKDGTWTDDPRAAAFLARAEAVTVPMWIRIADWLRGAPTARRAEATVEAIARHADLDPDGRASLPNPEVGATGTDPDAESGDREAAVAELEAYLADDPRSAAADGGDRS